MNKRAREINKQLLFVAVFIVIILFLFIGYNTLKTGTQNTAVSEKKDNAQIPPLVRAPDINKSGLPVQTAPTAPPLSTTLPAGANATPLPIQNLTAPNLTAPTGFPKPSDVPPLPPTGFPKPSGAPPLENAPAP